MTARGVFITVGLAAILAGGALWLAMQPARVSPVQQLGPVAISPAALLAASFAGQGRPQSLAQFQGKVVVLNFWATWCTPCREEMPAFTRLQARWAGRVQFVGLSAEEPAKAEAFGRELGVNYPLWTGGDAVGDLSRRLGNERGVLPHTAILGPQGEVLAQRVGPYTEPELEAELHRFAPKSY